MDPQHQGSCSSWEGFGTCYTGVLLQVADYHRCAEGAYPSFPKMDGNDFLCRRLPYEIVSYLEPSFPITGYSQEKSGNPKMSEKKHKFKLMNRCKTSVNPSPEKQWLGDVPLPLRVSAYFQGGQLCRQVSPSSKAWNPSSKSEDLHLLTGFISFEKISCRKNRLPKKRCGFEDLEPDFGWKLFQGAILIWRYLRGA